METKVVDVVPSMPLEREFRVRRGLYQAGLEGGVCDYYNNNAIEYDEVSHDAGPGVAWVDSGYSEK